MLGRGQCRPVCVNRNRFRVKKMEMVMLSTSRANVSSLGPSPQLGCSPAEGRPSTKILVVDEHFLIRDALCVVIKQLKNDATVLEASSGKQAMQLVSEQR